MAGGGLPHPFFVVTAGLESVGISLPVHVVYTWVVMLLLLLISFLVGRNLQMVPGRLQNVFEVIIGGLENFCVNNVGERGREHFHIICGLFLFILPCNWFGLIPGMDAPTANLNTNAALAIFLFLYYNWVGIRKWKLGYIKHFLGPVKAISPLMLLIELISHLSRPLSLTLRLFGNIKGEEIVLVLMFMLAPVIGSLPMYFLFVLAKTIQAFIFFMLGMIYLDGAQDHAH